MQRLLLLSLFQYQIAYNVIPQIGGEAYMGYACEEMKMQNKGRKILHLPEIKVSCTCVCVPVVLHAKEKTSAERARKLIAAVQIIVTKERDPTHMSQVSLLCVLSTLVLSCRVSVHVPL